MTIGDFSAIAGVMITVGGVLIYIGRSLGTLQGIGEGVKVALEKTDRHEIAISDLKVGLTEVKTRQDDCGNCP